MKPGFSQAILALAVAGWLGVAPLESAAAPERDAVERNERMARVEQVRLRGDLDRLTVLRTGLERELAAKPTDAALRYDTAYTQLRSFYLMRANEIPSRLRDPLLDEALAHTAWLLERSPDDVEARVLASALRGQLADRGMFARMREGRLSYGLASEAAETSPDNPRTQLQFGIVRFYAPSVFGGGSEKALEHFEVARELFDALDDAAPWPNWGRLDTDAWLGRAHAAAGRIEDARSSYRRALDRMPDYSWVRSRLLPELPAISSP